MRMQREALDLKSQLEKKCANLDVKIAELNRGQALALEAETDLIRQALESDLRKELDSSLRREIESSLRREWEVKARLEIDRLVKLELDELQRRFEGEVQAEVQTRVQQELQKKSVTFSGVETLQFTSSSTKSDYPRSLAGASTDTEFPSTTDITEFSVDSPEEAPTKKGSRAPFGRAQTMFERHFGTPMDVDIASPSPIAIASLSLSPRRANSTKNPSTQQASIFDETDDKARLLKARHSDPVLSDSEDDDTPVIPSPTRPPRSNKNPFAQRPVLTSTKTAPVNRLKNKGSMTSLNSLTSMALNKPMPPLPSGAPVPEFQQLRLQPSNGALRERGNSPNRRLSKIPSAANLIALSGENNPQRKTSLTSKKEPDTSLNKVVPVKTMKNPNVKGRTLIELQQARAGGRPVENVNSSPKRTFKERLVDRFLEPAPIWDPERDDMPSPFLVRRKPVTQA
jgi:NIMA (never in mitosis gene a)-related kinase